MRSLLRALPLIVLTGALMVVVGVPGASAAAPSNDTFAGATPITLPYTSGDVPTTEATLDNDDIAVASACNITGPQTFASSVWYRFTAPEDGTIAVDPTASSYPVAGAILTGSPSSFTALSCFTYTGRAQVQAGSTYYIYLVAYGPSGGTLRFSARYLQLPTISVTVDGGTFSRSGTATVTGTATCSAGASAYLNGWLSQPVGRVATIGSYFGTTLVCDGTSHPWSATTYLPDSGKFRGGKAEVGVFYEAGNADGWVSGDLTRTITLKGR